MKLLLVCALFVAGVVAVPVDPSSDVELVKPTNTNTGSSSGTPGVFGSGGSGVPIFVIRTQRRPLFGGHGFGGGFGAGAGAGANAGFPFFFPGLGGEQPQPVEGDGLTPEDVDMLFRRFFGAGGDQGSDDIPSDGEDEGVISVFGGPGESGVVVVDEDEVAPGQDPFANGCGFLCQVLRGFEDQIRKIESEVQTIRKDKEDEANEIPDGADDAFDDDSGLDVNNSTYTEEVLPDGTVVRVNRTVISDQNDDGTFFFHSTSFHNIQRPGNAPNDKPEAETEVDESEEEEEEDAPSGVDRDIVPLLGDGQEDFGGIVDEDGNVEDEVEITREKRSPQFTQQAVQAPRLTRLNPNNPNNPAPMSLHSDTRVNDLITENARRGGLVLIEPESEFIREDENGNIVPIRSRFNQQQAGEDQVQTRDLESNPWAQQAVTGPASGQLQANNNPWEQQTVPYQGSSRGQLHSEPDSSNNNSPYPSPQQTVAFQRPARGQLQAGPGSSNNNSPYPSPQQTVAFQRPARSQLQAGPGFSNNNSPSHQQTVTFQRGPTRADLQTSSGSNNYNNNWAQQTVSAPSKPEGADASGRLQGRPAATWAQQPQNGHIRQRNEVPVRSQLQSGAVHASQDQQRQNGQIQQRNDNHVWSQSPIEVPSNNYQVPHQQVGQFHQEDIPVARPRATNSESNVWSQQQTVQVPGFNGY